jgi:hypothetical protein
MLTSAPLGCDRCRPSLAANDPGVSALGQRLPKPKIAGSKPVSRSSEIFAEFAGAKSGLGPAWTKLLEPVAQGDDVEARALAVSLAHGDPLVARGRARARRTGRGSSRDVQGGRTGRSLLDSCSTTPLTHSPVASSLARPGPARNARRCDAAVPPRVGGLHHRYARAA